jgi:IS5 family transposase
LIVTRLKKFDLTIASRPRNSAFHENGKHTRPGKAAAARPSGDGESCDENARFAKKEGKAGSAYGHKAHIGMDQDSELIRTVLMTPANVNETTVADQLICFDEKAVYADKAYAKAERRQMLKAAGIKDFIMHKSWGAGPELSPWQR